MMDACNKRFACSVHENPPLGVTELRRCRHFPEQFAAYQARLTSVSVMPRTAAVDGKSASSNTLMSCLPYQRDPHSITASAYDT